LANLTRGITFTVNDFVTAAKLHALIDSAIAGADGFPGTPSLYNVDTPSLAAATRLIATVTPGSPAAGDLLVGSDGLLDIYDGAAFVDPSPDFIYLVNGNLITLATGTPVVLNRANAGQCLIHGSAGTAPDPFGVTLEQIAPSATGPVAFRGAVFMQIKNDNINAGQLVTIQGGSPYSAGLAQYGSVPALAQSGLSDCFAITLQPGPSGFSVQKVLLFK